MPAEEAAEEPGDEAGESANSGKTEEEMAKERMGQWIKSDSPAPPPPPTPELQQVRPLPSFSLATIMAFASVDSKVGGEDVLQM